MMLDTPLRIIAQRHDRDCGVACLGMLCGVHYENALAAIAMDEPNICAIGVETKNLRRAARRLGYKLLTKRAVDLETDAGMLSLSAPMWPSEHLVILKEGMIVDTDLTLWEADVFVSVHRARPVVLFMAEPISQGRRRGSFV